MKKPIYICAIALVIAGLVFSGMTAAFATTAVKETTSGVKDYSAVSMTVETEAERVIAPMQTKESAILSMPASLWEWKHWYQIGVAEAHDGDVALTHRYERDDIDIVGWTGSENDGKLFHLFDPVALEWWYCIYWIGSNGCHHPAYDYRGVNASGNMYEGTMVSIQAEPDWYSGDPFVTHCYGNPINQDSYTGSSWTFHESAQTRDMRSVDISCDPTLPPEQDWQWGVMSLVMSNDGDEPIQDAPYFFFQFNDTGWATLSYYSLPGCEYTHTDIDVPAQMAYSVYDYYNADDFQWQFFVRTDDWAEMQLYTGRPPYDNWTSSGVTWSFESLELGIRNPCVAAYDGTVVAITELHNSSNPDDIDLICWYTDDGNCSNFNVSVIAYSPYNEKDPQIQHIGGNSFICSFLLNDSIYYSRTNDGGETWSEPVLVSGDDVVIDDHGSSDISENGAKIMWSYEASDIEWYYHTARLGTRVYLSDEVMPGMTTCPAGDGPAYQYVEVTVWDDNGDPVVGIPAANFDFTVTSSAARPWMSATAYYGTLDCTFVPIDPVTDTNGKIRFSCIADTSIVYDILITATVNGNPINDRDRLPCKSVDYDPCDGAVNLGDFATFANHWGSTEWASDFDWDGDVDLGDFAMFSNHWGH